METTSEIHFTPREMEIIKLLLLDTKRREIAFNLDMCDGTLGNRIQTLFIKTGQHNMAGFILYVLTHGFEVNTATKTVTYNGKPF